MKKKDFQAFWIGLIAAAVLSYYLYRLLQPKREIAPRPLVVRNTAQTSPAQDSIEVSQRDVLTAIRGIGQVTENKLNDAGIYSYSQLASSSQSQLKDYTGNRWDPEDWIEQARELASSQ